MSDDRSELSALEQRAVRLLASVVLAPVEADAEPAAWEPSEPTPDPLEVAYVQIHGPRDLGEVEHLLIDERARSQLSRHWTRRCPNLTLLARAVSADHSAGAADRDDGVALAVATRHLVEECHSLACARCTSVLEALDNDPRMQRSLAGLRAHAWTTIVSRGERGFASADSAWRLDRRGEHVLVFAPAALDGASVVLVTAAGAAAVQIGSLESVQGIPTLRWLARTGSLFEVHYHPDFSSPGPEVDLESAGTDLGEELLWVELEMLLAAAPQPHIRGSATATAPAAVHLTADDISSGIHVEIREVRREWVVRLRQLQAGVRYRVLLTWKDGRNSDTYDFVATGSSQDVRLLGPDGAVAPPRTVRLSRLEPPPHA